MYMFDVGNGNATVLKSNNRILIVDFGADAVSVSSVSKHKEKICTYVADLINSTHNAQVGIILSHQDDDHINMVSDLLNSITGNFSFSLIGGKQDLKQKLKQPKATPSVFEAIRLRSKYHNYIDFAQNVSDQQDDFSTINNNIRDFLGQYITMEFLYPSFDTGIEEHDNNLIVRITAPGRSILLTGDMSPNLLAGIKSNHPEKLKNISVFQASHHGSNEHGELMLFDYENPSELILISGNPTMKPYLPKSNSIRYLLNSMRKKGFLYYSIENHRVTGCKGDIITNYKMTDPIFITYNIDYLEDEKKQKFESEFFYKIKLKGGCITLYEGNNKIIYHTVNNSYNMYEWFNLLLDDVVFTKSKEYVFKIYNNFYYQQGLLEYYKWLAINASSSLLFHYMNSNKPGSIILDLNSSQ